MADGLVEALERSTVEILITIDYAISSDHPSQILFEDDYVVVGWAGNPGLAGPMTRELYFELGHVTARFAKARTPAFEDWFVRRQKQQRRVEVVAPSFLSVPGMVIGSNRIATIHRRLAERVAEYLPLVVREPPLAIPPIREAIQWHLSNNNDPAIRWIVERLVVAAGAKHSRVNDGKVVPIDGTRAVDMSHDEITQQFQTSTAPGLRG
jgi:DNA-binding transcriptional LysR family regulator